MLPPILRPLIITYRRFFFIFTPSKFKDMQKPIDCDSEEFEYIDSIITGNSEPIRKNGMTFSKSMIKADYGIAVENFESRYNNDEIPTRYTYEKYMNDEELQTVLEGLKLDPDKFWLLILFCLDYAVDRCSGLTYGDNTKDILEKFIESVNNAIDSASDKTELTLKTDKSQITLSNGKALTTVMKWIKHSYDSIEDKQTLSSFDKTNAEDMFNFNNESDSVLIWYFAQLLRFFFDINPQFKGDGRKYQGLSLSKNLLISSLIYKLGLSKNKNFLYSDETLKGFFKQYKNKEIKTLGNIYFY